MIRAWILFLLSLFRPACPPPLPPPAPKGSMPETPKLKLPTSAELDRIVSDDKDEIAVNATKDAVTAEVSKKKWGFNFGAFGGWIKGKGWTGGGKIQRDL